MVVILSLSDMTKSVGGDMLNELASGVSVYDEQVDVVHDDCVGVFGCVMPLLYLLRSTADADCLETMRNTELVLIGMLSNFLYNLLSTDDDNLNKIGDCVFCVLVNDGDCYDCSVNEYSLEVASVGSVL